ncbi:uncharacterized protein LOC111261940 isoform X2 [Varroa jacobsoni]|nr:uncharacterized protein LOC111248941 isoform X2 [Varroa destructor]XP_022657817.1 uncharacterized protein LOC111248941 isoform X2 [Varroa destructor]XP_022691579.1 uncharacterized protein LOC111261940 isoform X2 [Varroa jacobsoni]
MVKATDGVPMAPTSNQSVDSATGYAGSPAALSARWAKLRADPALQRSAALRARLARRERRNRQRILRLQEFHRLRSMVPAIAQTPNVDKVTVIEEAIKYIDHLHEALRNKFTERGLPPSLQGLPIDLETTDMRAVVRLLANNSNSGGGQSNLASNSGVSRPVPMGRPLALPPPVDSIPHPCERQRNVPSYLLKMRLPRKQDHR